jgi:hypothetical protein
MSRPPSPLFLERESYRRRRLMDAARILPVLGLVLFLLPALWRQPGEPNTAGEAVYLFAVWALLILAAALLARPLRRSEMPRRPASPRPPPEPPPVPPTGSPAGPETGPPDGGAGGSGVSGQGR